MPDDETPKQRLERIKLIERLILIPLLLLAVGGFFTFGRAIVVGQSMLPTLKPGQRLTILKAWKLFSPLKAGDIVVVGVKAGQKNRDEEIVKRVIFIQNDAGTRPWPEIVKTPTGTYPTAALFSRERFSGNARSGIYILGDNINNSTDSRDFGAVFESEIIGKVWR